MNSDIDNKKDNKKKKKEIFVKPVFSYDQIVEIIDSRISELEKISESERKRRIRKKKNNKSKL